MNNIETMSNMKGLSEVIPKDNDGYCTIYKMDCADGFPTGNECLGTKRKRK